MDKQVRLGGVETVRERGDGGADIAAGNESWRRPAELVPVDSCGKPEVGTRG